ncbi:hypothetical protein [Brucella sp. BO2]|uniref:hypothetical protein n=1 Tax=Brucella sp. BO2 TaxID=693750 RepID=UPI00046D8747|nr:hypothetical protein [Brucella sp. BO2]
MIDSDLQGIARKIDALIDELFALRREILAHPRDRSSQTNEPKNRPEEYLEPASLAELTGLSPQHIRKLCRCGWAEGRPGISKHGGRYLATLEAISSMRV